MAALSPSISNTSTDTGATKTFAASVSTIRNNVGSPFAGSVTSPNPPKTLRGLNKPKCIRCGNVARSRCPYQSCKSCCSKDQNPCHIHVLKTNANSAEKTTSNSTQLDQHSTEAPSSGSSHRVSSLRQLSNNFAQFNNVQIPLRSKKPLTIKEALAINEWRFSKLKEYKDGNVESENEAFDRYMNNVSLLEEVFSVESTLEESSEIKAPHALASQEDNNRLISELKVNLRSNPLRMFIFRNRVQEIVSNGLEKLQKRAINDDDDDNSDYIDDNEVIKRPKRDTSMQNERSLALTELNEKLNKVRNEEDLKACLELKSMLFNKNSKITEEETENVENMEDQTAKKELVPRPESESLLPRLFSTSEIDENTLNKIDLHFSTLEQIEDL